MVAAIVAVLHARTQISCPSPLAILPEEPLRIIRRLSGRVAVVFTSPAEVR